MAGAGGTGDGQLAPGEHTGGEARADAECRRQPATLKRSSVLPIHGKKGSGVVFRELRLIALFSAIYGHRQWSMRKKGSGVVFFTGGRSASGERIIFVRARAFPITPYACMRSMHDARRSRFAPRVFTWGERERRRGPLRDRTVHHAVRASPHVCSRGANGERRRGPVRDRTVHHAVRASPHVCSRGAKGSASGSPGRSRGHRASAGCRGPS